MGEGKLRHSAGRKRVGIVFLTLRAVAVVWGDATGGEVNRAMDEPRLQTVGQSVVRGVPLGGESWKVGMATGMGWNALRPAPRKGPEKSS